jgi:hypothetical protein
MVEQEALVAVALIGGGVVFLLMAVQGVRASQAVLREPADRPLRRFERRADARIDRARAVATLWGMAPIAAAGVIAMLCVGVIRML